MYAYMSSTRLLTMVAVVLVLRSVRDFSTIDGMLGISIAPLLLLTATHSQMQLFPTQNRRATVLAIVFVILNVFRRFFHKIKSYIVFAIVFVILKIFRRFFSDDKVLHCACNRICNN